MDMFQFFREKDKYLYHYTSAKVAVKQIIRSNSLKVGRYVNTNDPKEIKDWTFSVGSNEGRDLSAYDLEQVSREMTIGLKHRTNVICFSLDRELTGDHVQDIYNRGFCKPRMWAQYAGNHTGVCLIFDKDGIDSTIRSSFSHAMAIHSGPVVYTNRSFIPNLRNTPYTINVDYLEKLGFEQYLMSHINTYYARLFFEKCKDWEAEKEYRWVLFGREQKELFFDFKPSLVGVVFGANCRKSTISKIIEKCKVKNIKFEQLVWKGCSPWYSYRGQWY